MRESIQGIKNPNYKHGGKGTRLYGIWRGMRARCKNPKSSVYKYYGAIGIMVCEIWQNSFESFRDWALINGYAGDLSLDRIETMGNYDPENCRWATCTIQNRNTRRNTYFIIKGVKMTMSEVCEKYGISQSKLSARTNRLGWPIEKAILNINTKRGSNKTATKHG